MTTFHVFHRWIESPSTSETVVLAFGGWWDADVAAAGGVQHFFRLAPTGAESNPDGRIIEIGPQP